MVVNGQKEPTLIESIMQFYYSDQKPESVIQVFRLTKRFGSVVALDHISIDFQRGKIHGIIGPNFSGKTALLKCICGLLVPDLGMVRVMGQLIGGDIKKPLNTGVFIDRARYLPSESGRKNLIRYARIEQLPISRVDLVLEKVGLDPRLKLPVILYSRSMQQKFGIAHAFLSDPDLLVLDEPLSNLDFPSIAEIKNLLHEERRRGKTIVITSQSSLDIAELCDTICKMDKGRIMPFQGWDNIP